MNFPFYSKLAAQIVEAETVITHPLTGEKYGGTDFQNSEKLAEIMACPLTIESVPEDKVATAWTIIDGESGEKIMRPTLTDLSAPSESDIAVMHERINTERLARLEGLTAYIEIDGVQVPFDADQKGRENLNGVLTAITLSIPVGETVLRRDSNNVNHALSQAQLIALGAAMLLATQAVFIKSWYIKDTVLPSLTPLQFKNFDVSGAFNA